MNFETLGENVTNSRLFKGSKDNPFLAPRGVFTANNMLFVSDTARNRVFIWNTIPKEEYQDPDIILGQSEVDEIGRNSGGEVNESTLLYPSGIWSNGKILVVADAWNHRVLIWHTIPTKNAQSADVVIGQKNFYSNLPNGAIGNDPTSQTLNWPYGVFSDGKSLWIADTGNRRVLFFDKMPTKNTTKADKVIGKPNFKTRDYDSKDAIWPYSVKINEKGNLAISDTQFYRVLIWNDKDDAFTKPANTIIGQDNFENCGQNQFRLTPESNTLNWTYDACFYKNGILVNDTGNSRVLGFNKIPKKNNENADFLVGRQNFNSGSDFKGNMLGTQSAIYWPFSIYALANTLYIADTGNHRVVICDIK